MNGDKIITKGLICLLLFQKFRDPIFVPANLMEIPINII